jgi:sulfate/thiosulfate transport system substrate-binding protein
MLLCAVAMLPGCTRSSGSDPNGPIEILNVSYDPTREFYDEYNAWVAPRLQQEFGRPVAIRMSHGGSGRQARAVIDGLEADVVTLAVPSDIQALVDNGGLAATDWATQFPDGAAPYTSTIVFLVRQGNPEGIRDWSDLIRDGVEVISPNPKTSGGARWIYLAAWGYALRQQGGSNETALQFVSDMYRHVPVLDSGARGASTTFARNNIGDVLLTWENEAYLLKAEMPDANFEIVMPSVSILARPPIALVGPNADAHGTREISQRYLASLYEPEAQEMAARHHYRPSNPDVLARYASQFAPITLFTAEEVAGDWQQAQTIHFADGAHFDQIYLAAGTP